MAKTRCSKSETMRPSDLTERLLTVNFSFEVPDSGDLSLLDQRLSVAPRHRASTVQFACSRRANAVARPKVDAVVPSFSGDRALYLEGRVAMSTLPNVAGGYSLQEPEEGAGASCSMGADVEACAVDHLALPADASGAEGFGLNLQRGNGCPGGHGKTLPASPRRRWKRIKPCTAMRDLPGRPAIAHARAAERRIGARSGDPSRPGGVPAWRGTARRRIISSELIPGAAFHCPRTRLRRARGCSRPGRLRPPTWT